MRQITVDRAGRPLSSEEAAAIRLEISQRMRDQAERSQLERRANRIQGPVERHSVQRAMLAVEDRIVRAFWVLARLPNDKGIGYASTNGYAYIPDRADQYANAVAAGGWLTVPPRPSPPDAKSIDAMHEPLDWLRWLDRDTARLVTATAQSKRGQTSANISWHRIRSTLPEFKDYTANRLHRIYRDGLRTIVTELTLAKMQ